MDTIKISDIKSAFAKAANALSENSEYLTSLDQEVGDGDLGITANKIADALKKFLQQESDDNDIGKFIISAGMKINGAAPSSLGSLIAISLMQAGKLAKDSSEIEAPQLAEMIDAAVAAMMVKGKAKVGDKTVIDALKPASEAFRDAVQKGETLANASKAMAAAAKSGMDSVTPLKSQIGRAGWVGERTIGKIDPGCALVVAVLDRLAQ